MRFAAIGLDHRHIYHLVEELLKAGAICVGYDPETSDHRVLAGFQERFPELAPKSRGELLEDSTVHFICCAAVPSDRARIAVTAMRNGKDVMVDKPGVISRTDLAEVKTVVRETGRIYSICFSERFVVPSTEVAGKLIEDGAIGRVIQTIGLGPHRLNKGIRPSWFFDPRSYGGILADIASHQIDQFLHFTHSDAAEIVLSAVSHFGRETSATFQDFGEMILQSDHARGYVRVDWFTPDGLPTWGDGRLIILGDEGTIELRKYIDLCGRPGTDHVLLVNREGTRYIDASHEPLTYFRRFLDDVRDRTETAMSQKHVFTVTRLALDAQERADAARVKERA